MTYSLKEILTNLGSTKRRFGQLAFVKPFFSHLQFGETFFGHLAFGKLVYCYLAFRQMTQPHWKSKLNYFSRFLMRTVYEKQIQYREYFVTINTVPWKFEISIDRPDRKSEINLYENSMRKIHLFRAPEEGSPLLSIGSSYWPSMIS